MLTPVDSFLRLFLLSRLIYIAVTKYGKISIFWHKSFIPMSNPKSSLNKKKIQQKRTIEVILKYLLYGL